MTRIRLHPRTGARCACARAMLILAMALGSNCPESSAPAALAAPEVPRTAPTPAPTHSGVVSFVRQMNDHRVSLGLQPLIWDSGVAAVARAHSQDMADRHFFSHANPDGLLPWDRLRGAGISYKAAGENIIHGYTTGASVLTAWLNSAGHRANIESPTYTHHGVGKFGTYWTHVFIRKRIHTTASR